MKSGDSCTPTKRRRWGSGQRKHKLETRSDVTLRIKRILNKTSHQKIRHFAALLLDVYRKAVIELKILDSSEEFWALFADLAVDVALKRVGTFGRNGFLNAVLGEYWGAIRDEILNPTTTAKRTERLIPGYSGLRIPTLSAQLPNPNQIAREMSAAVEAALWTFYDEHSRKHKSDYLREDMADVEKATNWQANQLAGLGNLIARSSACVVSPRFLSAFLREICFLPGEKRHSEVEAIMKSSKMNRCLSGLILEYSHAKPTLWMATLQTMVGIFDKRHQLGRPSGLGPEHVHFINSKLERIDKHINHDKKTKFFLLNCKDLEVLRQ